MQIKYLYATFWNRNCMKSINMVCAIVNMHIIMDISQSLVQMQLTK